MHSSPADTEAATLDAAREAAPSTRVAPPRPAARPAWRSRRSPAFAFFCAYVLFVVYATLLPFRFVGSLEALQAKRAWINWNPFVMVTGEPTPVADVISNVALFLPLGFIAFHAQRRRTMRATVLRGTFAGLGLSAGVELLQFFTPTRNPATSDMITNTLGAALGTLLAASFHLQVERHLRRRARAWMGREPLVPVLVAYALLVAVMSLTPFDLTPTISGIRHALRNAQFDPRVGPMTWPDAMTVAMHYAVLTALALRVASRLGSGPRLGRIFGCLVATGLLAIGLEILQMLVRSRVFSTRDILTAMVGSCIGAALSLALAGRRMSRHAWTLAAACYLACLIAQTLAPFRFELELESLRAQLRSTSLVPYSTYYYKATVAAVADFLDALLAYVPIGFVLARQRDRAGGSGTVWRDMAPVVLWCAAFALGLEAMQLAVPRRYPEVSDVLTASLGAGLGASAWRWFAFLASSQNPLAQNADGSAVERSRRVADPGLRHIATG